MKNYRELIVWQKAMELITSVYAVTSAFSESERYGLTSQMRRCAVSIPSYIAEGYGRSSTADYVRFLLIARGSLFELQTQIEIANRLGFLQDESLNQLFANSVEIDKMLNSLVSNLRAKLK